MNPGVLSGDVFDRAAIDWLLASDEPGIRAQARRELLGEAARDDLARVLDGPKVRALLDGQDADGGFGVNVYRKWQGAHWRLVSLVELGIPQGEPRALAAVETVIHWLAGKSHRATVVHQAQLGTPDDSEPPVRGTRRLVGAGEEDAALRGFAIDEAGAFLVG